MIRKIVCPTSTQIAADKMNEHPSRMASRCIAKIKKDKARRANGVHCGPRRKCLRALHQGARQCSACARCLACVDRSQVVNRVVRYPSGKEVEWDVVGSSSNYFVTVLPFNTARVRTSFCCDSCGRQLGPLRVVDAAGNSHGHQGVLPGTTVV